MLLTRRIKFLLATLLAASSLTLVFAAYSSSDARTESQVTGPTLKSKILRRKDRLNQKLNAYEESLLREDATVQEERQFEDKIPSHLPIKVKIRAEKEKAIRDLDNDRWASDFELEVKNTGTKPIYYLLLVAKLPEVAMGNGHVVFALRYGRPELSEFDAKVQPEDIPIKSGETVILKFGSGNALGWESFQRRTQTPQPKKIRLIFQQINFGDGTGFLNSGGTPWPQPPKKTALLGCGEGPEKSAINIYRAWLPNRDDFDSNKRRLGGELAKFLPAKFSYSSSLLFLPSVELKLQPDDPCCPSGCSRVRVYEDTSTCYGAGCDAVRRAEYVSCSDSRGSCQIYNIDYQLCVVEETGLEHNCPFADLSPCGSEPAPMPTPTPTPSPTQTPTPTPTPTPCPPGSFDPNPDGSCPIYANKINGCCVCQQRNTDCARFGQGTWPDGTPYCRWVEHLCDCYNIDGPCAENPRPSPAATVESQTGGTGGGGGDGSPTKQSEQCTEYWWVYYEYYGGEWHEMWREYAGCW